MVGCKKIHFIQIVTKSEYSEISILSDIIDDTISRSNVNANEIE